jgi:hypothetical protein
LNSTNPNARYLSEQTRKRCRRVNALLEGRPSFEAPFESTGLLVAKPYSYKHLSAIPKVIQICLSNQARLTRSSLLFAI